VFVSFTNRYQNNALLNAKATQQIQRMTPHLPKVGDPKLSSHQHGFKQIWQSEIIG